VWYLFGFDLFGKDSGTISNADIIFRNKFWVSVMKA